MKNKNTNALAGTKGGPVPRTPASLAPPVRAQERRLPVGGLCETDSRRAAKTEYVMRMLVRGRAPLEETAPAPEQKRPSASGTVTLDNLTFDDLLAELEKL